MEGTADCLCGIAPIVLPRFGAVRVMWVNAPTGALPSFILPHTRMLTPPANGPATRRDDPGAPLILVVNDVEETRDGIETLLTADGYRVDPARNENEAVDKAQRRRPDLVLVSLDGSPVDVIASAARIRHHAGLNDKVPIVIFYLPTVAEGAEVAIGSNVYVTWPDNFDQLRAFIARLLRESLWQAR
jgi:CheY-like chemotaxis protein